MSHLSRDERLLALDGALDGTRQAHLASCPACRTDVETLGGVLARVRAVDVPEPSPLFWDHLAARVGDAIAREPAPVPDRGWWSPRLAWAAAAVVIAAAGAGYLARSQPQPATAGRRACPAGRRRSGRPRAVGGRSRPVDLRRRRRLGAHRGGRRPGRGRRGLRTAGRAGRAVDLGAVRRRAPGAGGRAGRRTGAGPEPGRMTGIMWGRTFTQAAALGGAVLVVVLAGADVAGAQPRRLRVAAARHCRPLDRHRDRRRTRTSIRPSSARLFDAYTVMQAQEALGLDEARFGPFVTRLRALQEMRRRHLRERAAVMRDLRQLLQAPGNDAQLKERLDALVRLETATRADQAKAHGRDRRAARRPSAGGVVSSSSSSSCGSSSSSTGPVSVSEPTDRSGTETATLRGRGVASASGRTGCADASVVQVPAGNLVARDGGPGRHNHRRDDGRRRCLHARRLDKGAPEDRAHRPGRAHRRAAQGAARLRRRSRSARSFLSPLRPRPAGARRDRRAR